MVVVQIFHCISQCGCRKARPEAHSEEYHLIVSLLETGVCPFVVENYDPIND